MLSLHSIKTNHNAAGPDLPTFGIARKAQNAIVSGSFIYVICAGELIKGKLQHVKTL
jgi:hypothetical protein